MFRNSNLVFVAIVLSGCTVVTEDKKPDPVQQIEIGQIVVNKDAAAQGTMVEWNNGSTSYPLKADWKYGIEFTFQLDTTQPVYLYLDSSQNFDCNFGGQLLGPSYYLKFADGTEKAFDYEYRSSIQTFPGTSDADFPGLVSAGSHRIIARWFSNEECRMDVTVAARDRFAPENSNGPAIQRSELLGAWESGNTGYSYSMGGTLTLTDTAEAGNVQFDVYDFPYNSRYTAVVRSVSNAAAGFKVGDIIYCGYDINSTITPVQMTLACNAPGDTSLPDLAKDPVTMTR